MSGEMEEQPSPRPSGEGKVEVGVEDQKANSNRNRTVSFNENVKIKEDVVVDEQTETKDVSTRKNPEEDVVEAAVDKKVPTVSSTNTSEENIRDAVFEYDLDSKVKKPKIVEMSPSQRYVRFNDLLGEGAFKKVYRAYDTTQGVEVAWNTVKVSGMSASARQRVVQEMKILQELNHPSIIHFFSSFLNKEAESVVFITEMMASGTLKEFIQNRPVRLRIVKRWCRHILHALIYLHDHDPPIIHRDLKCDNIFINGSTGDIRIGDLGLASWQRNGAARSVLGTPEYMAPEMFEEMYDEQVDIYAFGMCVLEMITKETPFLECSSTPQIYKKVIAGIVPDCFNRLVDGPAKDFIYNCIRMPAPGEHRPTASEVRNDPFLHKRDNDPEDDIDCAELLKPGSAPVGSKRVSNNSFDDDMTMPKPPAKVKVTNAVAEEKVDVPVRAKPVAPPKAPSPALNKPTGAAKLTVNAAKAAPPRNRTPPSSPSSATQKKTSKEESNTEVSNDPGTTTGDGGSDTSSDANRRSMRLDGGLSQFKENTSARGDQSPASPTGCDQTHTFSTDIVDNFGAKTEACKTIKYGKGTAVEARFAGSDSWFGGRIQDINSDGTFAIKYEDQDYEASVDPSLIRISCGGHTYNLGEILKSSKRLLQRADSSNVQFEHQVPAPPRVLNPPPPVSVGSLSVASAPVQKKQSSIPDDISDSALFRQESTTSVSSLVSPPGEEASAKPCWRMAATGPVEEQDRSILNIRFTRRDVLAKTKQTVQFTFHLIDDQVTELGRELIDMMKLPRGDLEAIATGLDKFNKEYKMYLEKKANGETTEPFRSSFEQRQFAAVTARSESVDELAKYDRLLNEEQEKYEKFQAEHKKKLDEIKKLKEKYQRQKQVDMEVLSMPVPTQEANTSQQNVEGLTKEKRREIAVQKTRETKEQLRQKQRIEAEKAEKKLLERSGLSLASADEPKPASTLKEQMQKQIMNDYSSVGSDHSSTIAAPKPVSVVSQPTVATEAPRRTNTGSSHLAGISFDSSFDTTFVDAASVSGMLQTTSPTPSGKSPSPTPTPPLIQPNT
mmetsp:Transcript_39538/g.64054  ORF Transcript_39538/g.64054 Transcript_39538/m.64054 type:complete len:1061 (+) Transcript_39538:462-3644(+)